MKRHLALAAALAALMLAPTTQAQPAAAQQAAVATLPAPYNTANYEAGVQAFAACAECHAITAGAADKIGPNLHGVIGRRAGSLTGYDFSPALREANFAWDGEHLDAWIRNPEGYLPGNNMLADGVGDANQRRDIIAYLMIAAR